MTAPTRSGTSTFRPRTVAAYLLAPQQVITSAETGSSYRIERLLGEGGFGQVYLATRLSPVRDARRAVPEELCIKASLNIDGWLREAYFGQLLDGHPRAIQVFDRFPLMRDGAVVYCLALEYARHGDLSSYLGGRGRGWSEPSVRREIAGVLEVLGQLHRGQALHRDLTPLNVFVCDGVRLKLGDFGIVRHQRDRRGVTARTMNALTAPDSRVRAAVAHRQARGAADGKPASVPKWQARDDVYQVGQLLGMLIRGDARTRLNTQDVRRLTCSDHLKEIVHRCIGERRKRYENADEMISALRSPAPTLRAGVLRSLKGVHIAFTGVLSCRRDEAARAARRAGAIVHSSPSKLTTVLVRGRPNAQQAAGRDGGLKLMELKRLRERGYTIRLLNERQFWRLVGSG